MLMEGMLPAALADDAQQHLLAWMHVRIPVVGLVRILCRIVRVHVVGHRAPINQEVRWMVGLSWDRETSSGSPGRAVPRCRNLRQCLVVNVGIHFGELEKVFSVVA